MSEKPKQKVSVEYQRICLEDKVPIEVRESVVNYSDILQNIVFWGKICNDRNLTPPYIGDGASLGNLSGRIKNIDGVVSRYPIITGSRLQHKANMSEESLCLIEYLDDKRKKVYYYGKRNPSIETAMHIAGYENSEWDYFFHTHDDNIGRNAMGLYKKGALDIKGLVMVELGVFPSGSVQLANAVGQVLKRNRTVNAIIMPDHEPSYGLITLGKTADDAGNLAIRLQDGCKPK